MTEKEKFMDRFKEISKTPDFLGVYLLFNPESVGMTEESVYAELNRMQDAPDLPDVEVLGKYSP